MSYTHLTKPQLVDIVKRCTGSAGDYARKTKHEYEAQVAGLQPRTFRLLPRLWASR